jgi:hypothetical protein
MPGDVVYLPAGTYKISTQINIQTSGVTLRGDGSGQTIINQTSGAKAFNIGSSYEFTNNEQTVIGAKTKGTSNLKVSSSVGYTAGQLARLFVENETDDARIQAGANPVVSTLGYPAVLSPVVKIVAVGSGAITIDPPLMGDFTNLEVKIRNLNNTGYRAEKIGIEGITINGLAGSAARAVGGRLCVECWLYDVKAVNILNYPFDFDSSYRCEIRRSEAGDRIGGGSNGAALLMNACTSFLVADSHFYNFSPLMEVNAASVNNVIAYNLFTKFVGNCIIVNHNAHNMLNLYEGNVAAQYKSDGYYGSCSNETFFRNWFHGFQDGAVVHSTVQNRFSRRFAHVGNVFGWDGHSNGPNSYGNPNIGNGYYKGDAKPSAGLFWRDWKKTGILTKRNSDSSGVVTVSSIGDIFKGQGITERGPVFYWAGGSRYNHLVNDINGYEISFSSDGNTFGDALPPEGTAFNSIWPNALGFQERDLDCEASSFKTHNYHAALVGTGSVQNSTNDTLPASMAYDFKPPWFGNLTWPPVNPNSPNFDPAIIPAGYRFVNGRDPEGVDAPVPVPPRTVNGLRLRGR